VLAFACTEAARQRPPDLALTGMTERDKHTMMDAESVAGHAFSRRSALKRTAGVSMLLSSTMFFEQFARPAAAHASTAASSSTSFSDIQHNIGSFFQAASNQNDGGGTVQTQYPPVYALIQPIKLNRKPSTSDQTTLANALNELEALFPASPNGLLIQSIAYGLPYFNLLNQSVVSANMPKTVAEGQSPLIESIAFPTDVINGLVGGKNSVNPGVTKARFNVNVVIEANHLVLQMRSNILANLTSASLWLQGSNNLDGFFVPSPAFNGLFSFQTPRIQFVQQGLPKKIAQQNNFEFANRMSSDSTMAMGFIDQQTNAAGPAAITTFAGNSSAVLTTAKAGDYFDNAAIQHLSHDIEDLYQFFSTPSQSQDGAGEPYTERLQYMFRSNQTGTTNGLPNSVTGNSDQFTNNGGPSLLANVFQGTGAALAGAQDSAGKFSPTNNSLNATFTGTSRIGHNAALQQFSRASDGTPLHIRADGPGFDGMDMPAYNTSGTGDVGGVFVTPGTNIAAGSNMFKLQFTIYVPTAQLFSRMRTAQAAANLQQQFLGGESDDNGLERHITSTRRQNFLVPPRRHRAFPLIEKGA
jgi:hypothetical protein